MGGQTIESGSWDGSAQQSLRRAGELLSEPRRWSDWLSHDPARSELLAEAFSCIVRLEQRTGWPTMTLLRELGCRKEAAEQVRDMSPEEMLRCRNYFGWIEDLVAEVDRSSERQRIVVGASRLFRDLHGDLSACQASMDEGDFPPIEYLRLGEIDRAWETCRRGASTDGDARIWVIDDGQGTSHLRSKRIDRFLDGDNEAISPLMRKRIARHIAECSECAGAVERRREQRPVSSG